MSLQSLRKKYDKVDNSGSFFFLNKLKLNQICKETVQNVAKLPLNKHFCEFIITQNKNLKYIKILFTIRLDYKLLSLNSQNSAVETGE